jgi:hypothetical protein
MANLSNKFKLLWGEDFGFVIEGTGWRKYWRCSEIKIEMSQRERLFPLVRPVASQEELCRWSESESRNNH